MTDLDALAALLFSGGEYRFQMNLRKGEPLAYLRERADEGSVLEQRRRLCADFPGRYAQLLPEGQEALRAFRAYCGEHGLPEVNDVTELAAGFGADLLFMVRGADGAHRLAGGALCFPTGWALEEKLGRDMADIHGIVPGLNPAIGSAIHTFMSRIGSDVAFERTNWGLTGSPQRNRHPLAHPTSFRKEPSLAEAWLRAEHQLFLGLPGEGRILFGIRIEMIRLDHLATHPGCAAGLAKALQSMPAEVASYKGIASVRDGLARRLASA